MNLQKTQTLTFNYQPGERITRLCQFKWNNNCIKYLGIQIPKDLTTIYEHNYAPITAEIKADINRWSLLPISMYNRIKIVKMNMLPKLLFLFQTLPVAIPPKQFTEWNRVISSFIWEGKKPRIKIQTLQLSRDKGGLALPCLEHYYKAAQLRYLVCWCDDTYEAKWKTIEQMQINILLSSLLGDTNLLNNI